MPILCKLTFIDHCNSIPEAKSPSPPSSPPPDKASTPETGNMNESDMEKALEKVFKRVFGKIEKRLDTLQNSIDEIQSLISTRGSSAGAIPGPPACDRSLLVLPLTMKDMTRLETAEEDSDIRKLFVSGVVDVVVGIECVSDCFSLYSRSRH